MTDRWIGPYRLLEKLGEGGMGEVWLADQTEPVRRQVALKIIKHGMDTEQVVARFEAERQALAVMDHPAVAKVFDAGSTSQGRPYFVMEYVQGVPITKHCDQNRLTIPERLELFCQLCAGVQHAHQKAIIHRDLKPSNVLVTLQDGVPVPKIIDFGIAKATAQRLTERTVHTQLGVLIGTPEYMSPEQADVTAQDVDTRTDVYSLGVLLYELLVGALPFDPKELRESGYDGIVRKIREDEPSRPSTRLGTLEGEVSTESALRRRVDVVSLRKRLTGDLDWITMRSLEKDRSRRYPSPADLAADIRRHLGSLPVVAGPPSTVYRLRKFVARHRIGVGVAAAGVLALAAFGVVLAVQAKRIVEERDRANRVRNYLAERIRSFDPPQLGETLTKALRERQEDLRLAGQFSESEIDAALSALEPFASHMAVDLIVRQVMEPIEESIEERFPDDPKTQARLQHTVGHAYTSLGLKERSVQLLEQALATRRKTLGIESLGTLATLSSLGWARTSLRDYKGAEEAFIELLELRRRVLGDDDSQTLYTMTSLANSIQLQRRYDEAEKLLLDVLEHKKRIYGGEHKSAHTMHILACCYVNQAAFLEERGQLEESRRRFAEAEPLLEKALEISNEQPKWTIVTLGILADCRKRRGLYEEAIELYERQLPRWHRRHEPLSLATLEALGELYLLTDRVEDALLVRTEVAAARRKNLGPGHGDTLSAMAALAEVLTRAGRVDEAREQLLAVLESLPADADRTEYEARLAELQEAR